MSRFAQVIVACGALGLAACPAKTVGPDGGGGGSGGGATGGGSGGGTSGGGAGGGSSQTVTGAIGPDGGTLSGGGGLTLFFPPGTVDSTVQVSITATGTAAPATYGPVTPLYQFGPDGIVFAHPVLVSIPVPAGTASAAMYWSRSTDAGLVFDQIGGVLDGGQLVAEVVHFSQGFGAAAQPTRAISGSQVITYVSATRPGIINRAVDFSTQPISALVEVDGGYVEYVGSGQVDGTFVIPGVPNGEYMLKGALGEYFVTSRNAVDLGRTANGRPDAVTTTAPAYLALDISNLAPWQPTDQLELLVPDVDLWFFGIDQGNVDGGGPDAGDTSVGLTIDTTDPYYFNQKQYLIEGNHSPPDVAVLAQQVAVTSDAGFAYLQMQRIAELPAFNTAANGTATVSGALVDLSASHSIAYDVRASQFEALMGMADGGNAPGLGPTADMVMNTLPTIDVQGIAGGNASGAFAATADFAMGSWSYGGSDFLTGGLGFGVPAGENWGTFTGLFYNLSYRSRLPCTVGADCPTGTSRNGPLATLGGYWVADDAQAMAAGPIVPTVSFVQAPAINGFPFFAPQSGLGATPLLTWTAPSLGVPTQYHLQVYHLSLALLNGFQTTTRQVVANLVTPHPWLRVPAGVLNAGEPYVFRLIVEQGGYPTAGQAPFRTGFPATQAAVVSAIMRP